MTADASVQWAWTQLAATSPGVTTTAGGDNHSIALLDIAEDWKVGSTSLTEPYYWGIGGSTIGNKVSWGLLNWTMYGVRLDVDGAAAAVTDADSFETYAHEMSFDDENTWYSDITTAANNIILKSGTMLNNACHIVASSMQSNGDAALGVIGLGGGIALTPTCP